MSDPQLKSEEQPKPVVPARDDPEFGRKVRLLRETHLHLGRPELAHKLGMGQSTLYNWEEKNNLPNGAPEGTPPLPPSTRLYNRLVAFVHHGETFEDKKMGNASTGPKRSVPAYDVQFQAGVGLKFENISTEQLVKALTARGFKVTLEM